ncbi:MAG TPA: hypothetical protein VMB27_18575 [Solirubrobacteraceae bacterium]|nr:hypothetical protein [Solirubrobacteraceae bacterium]
MEHLLRQCLIALRIAEQIGLEEEHRATVYYTALLINVGCHYDTHEREQLELPDAVIQALRRGTTTVSHAQADR